MALKKAPKKKILCPQGKTFRHSGYIVDNYGNKAQLDGYTGRIEIRTQLPDESSTTGDEDVLFTLTTENGGIVIDAPNGRVSFYISAEDTASFPVGSYFWELEIIDAEGEIPYLMAPSVFQVLGENTL